MTLLIGIAALAVVGKPQTEDPAFALARQLVGGVWEGTVGKNVRVEFRFHSEEGGKLIVSEGTINAGTAHPLIARSSLGWDAAAKKMYYLDQHGSDTVYWGHVTREDNSLVFDFRPLAGDTGHYISRATIGKDEYTSTMSEEKDGKLVDMGFHLSLKRRK